MPEQTILIVDDDRQIAESTALRLRSAGYKILVAHDGAEGVATAHLKKPDAIVLDIRMPFLDGMAALGELKSNSGTRRIPVVMLSASVVDQNAALDAGARFFVRKPFCGRELVDAVNVATNETSFCSTSVE